MLKICDHPLITHKLNQIRDKECPPEVFRRELHEIARFLTYEVMRDFEVENVEIETPLEVMESHALKHPSPALISILRAGNGLLGGALEVLPHARVGFLGMYRDEATLEPVDYYTNLPSDLSTAPVLLLDPMLATGGSASGAVAHLKNHGAKDIRLITLVSAPEGVKKVNDHDPDVVIYTAALDRQLNEKGYILPGLGDAGDRIYNTK